MDRVDRRGSQRGAQPGAIRALSIGQHPLIVPVLDSPEGVGVATAPVSCFAQALAALDGVP